MERTSKRQAQEMKKTIKLWIIRWGHFVAPPSICIFTWSTVEYHGESCMFWCLNMVKWHNSRMINHVILQKMSIVSLIFMWEKFYCSNLVMSWSLNSGALMLMDGCLLFWMINEENIIFSWLLLNNPEVETMQMLCLLALWYSKCI